MSLFSSKRSLVCFHHTRQHAPPMDVKSIPQNAVLKISSGQVVVNLSSATKELIENAIDAGATSIEIIITNNGLDCIEVSDNGKGIPFEHYETVALRYTTSKLETMEDLSRIHSFGFRGEGLNSLCAVAKVSAVTRTSKDPTGYQLVFNEEGQLQSKTPIARGVGTTFKVAELFYSFPVRRIDLTKNSKREYARLLSMLQAYAIICYKTSFTVSHVDKKGERTKVLYTPGKGTMSDSLTSIYGKRFMTTLMPFEARLHDTRDVSVSGYVSINDSKACKTNAQHQFTFLNGRPVDLPKLSRSMNEVYRQVNAVILRHQSFPVFMLNITMPPDMIDINMAPDKRTVLFSDQDHILQSLRSWLCRKLDPEGEKTFELQILPPLKLDSPPKPLNFSQTQGNDKLRSTQRQVNDPMHLDEPTAEDVPSSSAMLIPTPPQLSQLNLPQTQYLEVSADESQTDNRREDDLASFEPPRKKEADPRELELTTTISTQGIPYSSSQLQETESVTDLAEITPLTPAPKRSSLDFIMERYNSQKPISQSTSSNISLAARIGKYALNSRTPSPSYWQKPSEIKSPRVGDDEMEGTTYAHMGASMSTPLQECDCHLPTHPHTPVHNPRSTGILSPISGADASVRTNEQISMDTDDTTLQSASSHQRLSLDNSLPNTIEIDIHSLGAPVDSIVKGQERVKLKFNMESFATRYRSRESRLAQLKVQQQQFQEALKELKEEELLRGPKKLGTRTLRRLHSMNQSESQARSEMSKHVSKSDFANMAIVGQFNESFIIAKLDEDLFILDQHACDEKYKFEQLCERHLASKKPMQPLMRPILLELPPPDADLVLSNLDEFAKRGFRIEISSTPASPIHRLQLTGHAQKKGDTDYLLSKIQEIVDFARDGTLHSVERLPSEHKEFASKACRSAVMCGHVLTYKTMKEIVGNMSTMNQPWNCPHGRPTMRHLTSLLSKPSHQALKS